MEEKAGRGGREGGGKEEGGRRRRGRGGGGRRGGGKRRKEGHYRQSHLIYGTSFLWVFIFCKFGEFGGVHENISTKFWDSAHRRCNHVSV